MILGRDELLKLILESQPPLIEGWVDLNVQLQPAGFDLTLKEVRRFKGVGHIDFDNRGRVLPDTEPIPFEPDGRVHLSKGAYVLVFNEIVNLPLGIAAIAKPRSSLIRCGASVETAVWDPGYRGRSRALLVVYNDSGIVLERNARVVQLMFIRVQGASVGYGGAYQGES
ncbi:MAG: deoxyuridine 5'-triphosphate nucleotidohydrolase [Thermofilaceae archaeon]